MRTATVQVFLLLSILLLAPGTARGEESLQPSSLRVAAVQLAMDPSLLVSMGRFSQHIETLVAQALSFRPDLVVFPEYTSVFLALLPYYEEIRRASGAAEGLERIARREPLVRSFRDLFLLNSGLARQAMDEVFGSLARRHAVPILAGSYFAWDGREGAARLVNRAVLYGADGRVAYSQDKVYLTPFEGELLGLSAGSLEDAAPFRLNGRPVGLTICRDTFFGEWQQRLRGSLLWIDIKANGQRFTEEEQARFLRALPARIAEGAVPYGLTVCLTGRFLDLYWEGESSLVRKGGQDGTEVLARAASPEQEEVLLVEIPLPVDPPQGP